MSTRVTINGINITGLVRDEDLQVKLAEPTEQEVKAMNDALAQLRTSFTLEMRLVMHPITAFRWRHPHICLN